MHRFKIKKLIGLSLLTALLTMMTTDLFAENRLDPTSPDWTLHKDSQGIQVYLKSVEGSGIKAFMGKARLNASMSSILRVMQSAETCVEWLEGCSYSTTLDGGEFRNFYQYAVNDLPWPVSNRDYVLHIQASDDPASGQVQLSLSAVQGQVPKTRHVRLTHMDIQYILNPVSVSETEVIWLQHTEPAGHIPDWLVNLLLISIPYNSLGRLEDVANRDEFRNVRFVHDSDGYIVGFE